MWLKPRKTGETNGPKWQCSANFLFTGVLFWFVNVITEVFAMHQRSHRYHVLQSKIRPTVNSLRVVRSRPWVSGTAGCHVTRCDVPDGTARGRHKGPCRPSSRLKTSGSIHHSISSPLPAPRWTTHDRAQAARSHRTEACGSLKVRPATSPQFHKQICGRFCRKRD